MMQQNAINAQNQQNFYNQQMPNIRRNTPTYMLPIDLPWDFQTKRN
jgi:hypothetical protein